MPLLRRLEKVRRFLRWRFGPRSSVPVYWHVGRPNFGDDVNPTFFAGLHGCRVRFASDRRRPHVLGAGSILRHAEPASVVCGSGFLRRPDVPLRAREVVAVRGALSAEGCGGGATPLLGDPLVLVDQFVTRPSARRPYGFVPHVTSVGRWRRLAGSDSFVIDPTWSPWRTIAEIAACDVIVSQSLHGLIVADALGIPNVWVTPSDDMAGGRFKFDDYFSTLDRSKEPAPECRDLFTMPQCFAAEVAQYRFCKQRYREALVAGIDRVAAAWTGR